MNWIPVYGNFKFSNDIVVFQGQSEMQQQQDGSSVPAMSSGLAICNKTFSGGNISADITFDTVNVGCSCDLVLHFNPINRAFLSVSISKMGTTGFSIRLWDGVRWHTNASGGDANFVSASITYHLQARLTGSDVKLQINGVDVLNVVVPFSIPSGQVGLFVINDSPVRISNFKVEGSRGKAFVAMQYSSPFNEIFDDVLARVCDEFNLDAYRADQASGPGVIINDMVRDIAESEFVIADISAPNPNVYYELGYAHAIGKPVIILASRELDKIPFDVSGFRILFYNNSIPGKTKFEEGLRKHISAIQHNPSIEPSQGNQPLPIAFS